MLHRLTIYRHHDNADVTLDFDLPPEQPDQIRAIKETLTYDLDNPVFTLLIVGADNTVRGVAVATHEIDHLTLAPLTDEVDHGTP